MPRTSPGLSKITRDLSPSLSPSNVLLRIARSVDWPYLSIRIIVICAVESPNPLSRLSASIAISSPFSGEANVIVVIIAQANVTNMVIVANFIIVSLDNIMNLSIL